MDVSRAFALAAAAAVGWALFDLLRRALADRLSAWSLVAATTLGALPLLALGTALDGDWTLAPGYWLPGLASVALNVAANFGYFRSLQMSPLSVTLPMLSFTPMFASALGAIVLGEELSARALGGALLVVFGGLALGLKEGGLRFEPGSAVMLGVALLWSATLLLDKRAMDFASPYLHALVLNLGVAAGGVCALVLSRRTRELGVAGRHAGLLTLAIAVGALALVVQLLALREMPVGVIETVKRGVGGLSAVAFGRWLYGEPVTLRKIGAILLMTAGVALLLL